MAKTQLNQKRLGVKTAISAAVSTQLTMRHNLKTLRTKHNRRNECKNKQKVNRKFRT